ncbi:DUF192 domain-containing protein [Roseovarius sp.]|uniref:DUF192 domain-containing protein n=1 Tax=Roseovarius sp. TaxID=1486281 RepID=UPI003A97C0AB
MTGAAVLACFASTAVAESCREDVAMLRSDAGTARFRIEVADDKQERAQGLMNRETLSKSAGMLFVYPKPQSVGFWMKNTLIPLDMIFMDETGTVKKVHHEAQPLDESPIFGGDGILAVLEINGGLARKIGITEGWAMRHNAIDQSKAAWPCSESQ